MNRVRPATPRSTDEAGLRLGERVRQLRVAAGMTQGELAGDRFSKEYVSQIERGKTRPTRETIEWLATRLGADASFLENGVSTHQRDRVEAALAQAEALTESGQDEDAVAAFQDLHTAVAATGHPELEVRLLKGEAKVRARTGDLRGALALASRARELTEAPAFSDLERAEVLYVMGGIRLMLSSVSTAVTLLSEALTLADRSGLPCDQLRSNILDWRSRCYQRQRDFEAAKDDVERALELAERLSDPRTAAALFFQGSVLAEREGQWILARSYAERAKAIFEELADRENVGKMLNNLGGLNFLLGKPDEAIRHLKGAFAAALEVGSEINAAYAVSSLAQVHLRTGAVELAEEQARHALELLGGRVDLLGEIGNAQLVLGRALLEQGRLDEADETLEAAESSFEQMSSGGHRAAAWLARGDVAARRGDDRAAARLYRLAAEALQDVRF